jgi:thiamine biosynthesis lipoprotein
MKVSRWQGLISRILMVAAVVIIMGTQATGCGYSGAAVRESGDRAADETAAVSITADEVAYDERFDSELFAMDTFMTLTAYGPHATEALEKAGEEIQRLEAILSTGLEDSEVSKINSMGEGVMTEVPASLMASSIELWKKTDGAFNPAILPVMRLWGFTDGSFRVPGEDELQAALALLDVSLIDFDQETGRVSFGKEGMAVDFGGIAKGYTSARIMDIFDECGVTSAMVNLGGNVQTYGTKPDGKKWKIAVQDPKKEGNYLCIIDSAGQAIITSGGYERYFEEDGVRYHHIIDPSDGYPADNGLVSVTIVSADGTLADGLSTSLFVMGRDKAIDYWREHSGEFEMVLYTDGGELLATEGLKDILTSEYAVTYIGST